VVVGDSDQEDGVSAGYRPQTGRGSRRTSVADAIDRFSPSRVAPMVWSRIEGVAREWVAKCFPDSPTRAVAIMGVVAQLLCWADGVGESFEAYSLLHPETIDRFLAHGCQHLKEGTRANYRTSLRKVGRAVLGPELFPHPTQTIAAQDPTLPYTPEEIAAQLSWVRGLPTDRMRRNALVLLSLGRGAGLRANEMSNLTGTAVTRDESGVLVHVSGENARQVPVLKPWEKTVFDLAQDVGERFVFRPDRIRAETHQTSNFVSRCAKSTGAPPEFSLMRLRGTWLVDLLVGGIPPNELAKVAGIQRTQLAKYFALMPDSDPATVRGWLRDGGRR